MWRVLQAMLGAIPLAGLVLAVYVASDPMQPPPRFVRVPKVEWMDWGTGPVGIIIKLPYKVVGSCRYAGDRRFIECAYGRHYLFHQTPPEE